MKAKSSVKILIGLTIVLSISLVYGASEFIFQNIKLNSPQIKENNKIVEMENPIGKDIIANNNIEEKNDDFNEDSINENPNKNDTSNSTIVDDSKTDDKQYVENNHVNSNNNIDNSNEAKNPEKMENADTKESKDKDKDKDKNNNEKGNNNKNNNNGNKKNNDIKNNKGNNKKDKDKPILENNLISEEEALEIGFKKVGSGGNLENIEAYLDDNPPKYKIEIIKNKQKYKFEIHARTGSILEYEKEKLNNK